MALTLETTWRDATQLPLPWRTELPRVVAEPVARTYGEVFTRRWVVELLLDLVGYTADRDLAAIRVLEPACGHGAFLVPIVERLSASLRDHGRTLADASHAIGARDVLPTNVAGARRAVRQTLVGLGWDQAESRRAAACWVSAGDFLTDDDQQADIVVGNPPYIRLEDVPPARCAAYRAQCTTMVGRADVFVGFYERGLQLLRPGGRLGFICADRWMRNSYGERLRSLVTGRHAVDVVVSMHDVDAFEETVSAYPAITVLRAGPQGPAVVAETTSEFGAASAEQLVKWVASGDRSPLSRDGLSAAWVPTWFAGSQSWPAGSPERLALIAALEARHPALEEDGTGTRIGIGVASGADRVFVTNDAGLVEPSRLLPIAMGADVRTGTFEWSGHYLVNPWTDNGLVDLDEFPRLARYLRRHRALLTRRATARKNPRRWYRTIDRVIPGLRQSPKLLFRDLGYRIAPVLDDGGHYPHHNLYWVTTRDWDLKVLGGLLLSDVADLFVSTYCVRMRGGTLRFQAQYLRRIRVPELASISQSDRDILADAFERRDTALATQVALKLYGVEAIPA